MHARSAVKVHVGLTELDIAMLKTAADEADCELEAENLIIMKRDFPTDFAVLRYILHNVLGPIAGTTRPRSPPRTRTALSRVQP